MSLVDKEYNGYYNNRTPKGDRVPQQAEKDNNLAVEQKADLKEAE